MKLRLLTTFSLLLTLIPCVVRLARADYILSPPQIADGRVVFTAQEVTDVVEPGEIYLYDTASGMIDRLTDDDLDDSSPRINEESIVWVRTDDNGNSALMIYDLITAATTQAPEDFVWGDSPQADGDLTVLTRDDGEDREIVIQSADLKTDAELTENDAEDTYPSISGSNLAWVRGEGEASEIFLLSESGGGEETQVTDNDYEDSFSNIEGGYLVWQGNVDGDWEIFTYNVESANDPVQVTQNSYDDISPQTDGNYLVWLGYSHSGGGIFVRDISTGKTTQLSTETGDQDCDWDLDLADAILALGVLGGKSPLEPCLTADMDNEGKIGLSEILYILQHLANVRD